MQHHGDCAAQVIQRIIFHIVPAHEHLSLFRLIQPWDHLDKGGFCAACAANDANGFSGADRKADIRKHGLLRLLIITEEHMPHLN